VITREERSAPERAWRATLTSCEADAVGLELTLSGDRAAHLRVGVPSDDRVEFTLAADGDPLRLAIDWDQRAEERFVGTGFAAVLPERGYGFWKGRDFHEHRDDVIEDLEGFRRHHIPSPPSSSTRPGRRNTTPGSSTPTSSPTPPG
jgi:hypothetical protein